MTSKVKARVRYVDIAKGVSISLVALAHSKVIGQVDYDPFNRMLGTFLMPFFFFASGLFFSYSNSFLITLGQKTDQLLKPYFVTLSLVTAVHFARHDSDASSQLIGMFYGTGRSIGWPWIPLWFLPHLWVLFMASWMFLRWTRFGHYSVAVKLIILCLLYALGTQLLPLFWYKPFSIGGEILYTPGLPFSLDLALISGSFFLLGIGLKSQIVTFRPHMIALIFCVGFVFAANELFHPKLDLNRRMLEHEWVTGFTSVAGIYIAICLAYLLDKNDLLAKMFSKIGEKSLFVLIFHMYVYSKVVAVLRPLELGWIQPVAALVACIFAGVLIGELVRRIPFLCSLYYPVYRGPRYGQGEGHASKAKA